MIVSTPRARVGHRCWARPRANIISTGLLGLGLALPPWALAADAELWGLCPPLPASPAIPAGEATPTSPVDITAGTLEAQPGGATTVTGGITILRPGQRLEGETAEYDAAARLIRIRERVAFYTRRLDLHGTNATIDLGAETAVIEQARYLFRPAHAFGEASQARLEGTERAEFSVGTYTTCPPADPAWQLRAETLTLDRPSNTGEAFDVTLEAGGVPVMYLPYINFPLEGRKSGLLAPSFGTSERNGTDLAIPYYFNIAPNRDATLTPRWLSKRGAMLQGEFRYLNAGSEGQFNLDYLPNDDVYGDTRHYVSTEQRAAWGENWSAALVYHDVSDDTYFEDLDNTRSSSSQTHLPQRLDLRYDSRYWRFLARAQRYESLVDSTPYQRLPQLLLEGGGEHRPGQLQWGFSGEWTQFDNTNDAKVTGSRLDVNPSLSLPLRRAAWFATPRLGLHYTQYDLSAEADDTQPSRTVPSASLDTGLFLERDVNLFERALVQTLEPRLYYLYVPYRDQEALPVFDTSRYEFSFAQMFQENRFSGPDRIGDANQLTAAVTTRFLDGGDGRELARASVGEVLYFRDREVTLPNQPVDDDTRSEFIAELAATPLDSLELRTDLRWDPEQSREELLAARIQYQPGPDRGVGLAYRYRRDEQLRQLDAAVYWPLNPRWKALARWNYDLEQDQSIEATAGLEYESCCWGVQLVARGRRTASDEALDHSILFTIELKGLSRLGRSLADELDRGILGYR